MKIAVLGIGNIGGTLGKKWAKAGHTVAFGVRDVNAPKVQAFLSSDEPNQSIDTLDRAITFGAVVVLAVPGTAVDTIVDANDAALYRKIIIDATNKVGVAEMSSVANLTARLPAAKVYRAFNTLGWENFAQPQFGTFQADLFYCGSDDPSARQVVEQLIADIGLRPIRVGGLEQVTTVDAVTRLWFALALGQKRGRHLAFKVLMPEGMSP